MALTTAGVLSSLSLAVGAASTAATLSSQKDAAENQMAYQQALADERARMNTAEQQALAQSYADKSATERIDQMNQRDAAALQEQEIQAESLRKQGTMLASSNTAGLALDRLMGDYMRQEAADKERVRQSVESMTEKSATTINNYHNQTQATLNAQRGHIASPTKELSSLEIATALGKTGLQFANTMYNQ